jgi:hypothetical protein
MNPRESLQYLTQRLRRLRSSMLLRNLFTGAAIIITVASGLLILGWLFNLVFWLTTDFRTVFIIAAGAWLLGLLAFKIIARFMQQPSTEDVALKVEKQYPELKNQLIASLQLEKNLTENREGFSTELIGALIERSRKLTGELDFGKAVDRRPLRKWGRNVAVAMGLLVAVALLFPGSFGESVYLYSHPRVEIERELGYDLSVSPQNVEIAKFAPLTVTASVFGREIPDAASLFWRYPDGPVKEIDLARDHKANPYATALTGKLSPTDTVNFSHEINEVRRTFKYWVGAGELNSEIFTVTVVDKPRVIGLKLTYNYPDYTGLAPLVVDENDGNISAVKGTRVKISAAANKEVKAAMLVFADGDTQALEVDKQRLSGSLRIMENGSYHINVTDDLGHHNEQPIEYRIEKIADLFPEVDIYSPGVPVDLDDRMALDLGVKLFDDFGFSKINLIYRIFSPMGETFEVNEPLPFARDAGRDFELRHHWAMDEIGLEPGGYVEYYIEAFDNDNISGPKRGLSQVLTARLPSLDEMFAYLEDEGEEQVSTLEELRRQQENLSERMEELQEELLTNQEMDWEQRKDVEQALKSQQDIMKAMEEVAERLKETEDQMRENNLTSLEVLQKMQELQKLFEKVATPEMKEAMRKMQEALDKMSAEEMKKAAEEMQLSQEELLERLERSLALLKMMQLQQKMEALTQMLEQLMKQQEQVNQATEKSPQDELSKLAPKEERNREQFDQIQQGAKELEDMLKEMNLDQEPNAQKFCKSAEKSKAGETMDQMQQSLQNSQQQQAQQQGEQAMSELAEMLEQLNEAKNQFNMGMGQEALAKMRGAFDDLLYVSDEQEDVLSEAADLDPRSPQLRNMAAEQQTLERTLESLREKMTEVSKESAFFDQQINKLLDQARECMGNSTTALSQSNGAAAKRYQKDAMYSLNQAASSLLQSMQSQSQCNSGSCNKQNMFKKMGQMCKKQNKINQQSAGMCDNPNQGKPGEGQIRKLAAEQSAIQKSLQELQNEQGNRPEMLGRLDEMAREVERIVEDLERGHLDEGTLERQHKIHSRMLDFQRSLERQDFKEERRADSGRDFARPSPDQLRFADPRLGRTYQDRLQKFLNEDFPEEYEELVKGYFRAINQQQEQK